MFILERSLERNRVLVLASNADFSGITPKQKTFAGENPDSRFSRICKSSASLNGARGSLVVKALGYKTERRGFETR
jgi:hypothetical protein